MLNLSKQSPTIFWFQLNSNTLEHAANPRDAESSVGFQGSWVPDPFPNPLNCHGRGSLPFGWTTAEEAQPFAPKASCYWCPKGSKIWWKNLFKLGVISMILFTWLDQFKLFVLFCWLSLSFLGFTPNTTDDSICSKLWGFGAKPTSSPVLPANGFGSQVLMACIILLCANTGVTVFSEDWVSRYWMLHVELRISIFTACCNLSVILSGSIERNPFHPQAYGFLEVFSGDAWVSKCMKANGIPTASFDVRYGDPKPGKQNAMDILSDAGFSLFNCIWRSFISSRSFKTFLGVVRNTGTTAPNS